MQLPQSLKNFEDADSENKLSQLENLVESDDTALVVPLVQLMEREKDRAVKERMLILLSRLLPMSNFVDIDRLLKSPDPFVRNGAVEIIKKNDIPLLKFFAGLAADQDRDVRKFVIDAISQEASGEAIAIIRQRLKDEDINIVYTAIEYLGNLKDEQSADSIEDILFRSDNYMVICSALQALAKIGVSPRKDEIMERFLAMENSILVFPLLRYMSTFGPPSALVFIGELLETHPETFTKEIIDAIEGIVRLNNLAEIPETLRFQLLNMLDMDTNTANKYEIIKMLARTGGEDALLMVRDMLADENEMIRLSAVEILGDIGTAEDLDRLKDLVEETDSDELLEAIGDAVMKIDERIYGDEMDES